MKFEENIVRCHTASFIFNNIFSRISTKNFMKILVCIISVWDYETTERNSRLPHIHSTLYIIGMIPYILGALKRLIFYSIPKCFFGFLGKKRNTRDFLVAFIFREEKILSKYSLSIIIQTNIYWNSPTR